MLVVSGLLLPVPILLLNVFALRVLGEQLRQEQRQAGSLALESAQRVLGEYILALDPGFGVETMTLRAARVEPFALCQKSVFEKYVVGDSGSEISDLIDRLTSRLGAGSVYGPAPRESHLPERAAWVRRVAIRRRRRRPPRSR